LPALLAELETLGLATDSDRSNAAFHFLRAGRHGEAVPILEDLVARAPDDGRARFNLGFAYLGLGRHADAERAFRTLVDRDPRNRQAWQNLLWIYQVTGDRAAHERAAAEMAAALGDLPRPASGGTIRSSLPGVVEVPAGTQPGAPIGVRPLAPVRADTGRAGAGRDGAGRAGSARPRG
jgi:tetratricopeptide (TPR) repeat protein